jgi:predicted GIY-YIG superfamily endonuclease
MLTSRRKPRKDCNYIIYNIVDELGNSYIGLTRKTTSSLMKSVKLRWSKHMSRAKCDNLGWVLYEHIRLNEEMKWTHEIVEVVRGRKEAYARERELILELQPLLNTQYMKDK